MIIKDIKVDELRGRESQGQSLDGFVKQECAEKGTKQT